MESAAQPPGPASRQRILDAALVEFAARGYEGARLQDIARTAGLSRPTLLYHFESKEGLYAAVIEAATADWATETHRAISVNLQGFEQIASLVRAAFHFFETHRDFVRVLRREAIEGGERLGAASADVLAPFIAQGVAFLERETAAGRLRTHDPLELMAFCYASVFTHFSEAAFRARVLDEDPLAPGGLQRGRDALIALLRAALEPGG
ncbi:MAG: TetR family transcriptional regulator [Actinomycetota bacterium]|nr:TetR family transcriptional regulator [Actinomycetota bacterium]